MKLIDANVILRYLLADIPEQWEAASAVIESGAYTIPMIIAEVVYVLQGVYNVPREKIAETMIRLLQTVSVVEPRIIACALELYRISALDFADCTLIAYNHVDGADVFSFDRKLNKHLMSS